MSTRIRVSGASDDLVELDLDYSEEYGCYNAVGKLTFRDSNYEDLAEVFIYYSNNGFWKIEWNSDTPVTYREASAEDGRDQEDIALYSDTLTLDFPVDKVLVEFDTVHYEEFKERANRWKLEEEEPEEDTDPLSAVRITDELVPLTPREQLMALAAEFPYRKGSDREVFNGAADEAFGYLIDRILESGWTPGAVKEA